MTDTGNVPEIMAPSDVQRILKVSRNTAYEVFHRHDFPSIKIGKQYRVRREHSYNWLDKMRIHNEGEK